MSGGERVPLHWQRDLGGAQADANLAFLDWAQGKLPAPKPDDEPDEDEQPDEPIPG